jgi:hypothetical protein
MPPGVRTGSEGMRGVTHFDPLGERRQLLRFDSLRRAVPARASATTVEATRTPVRASWRLRASRAEPGVLIEEAIRLSEPEGSRTRCCASWCQSVRRGSTRRCGDWWRMGESSLAEKWCPTAPAGCGARPFGTFRVDQAAVFRPRDARSVPVRREPLRGYEGPVESSRLPAGSGAGESRLTVPESG